MRAPTRQWLSTQISAGTVAAVVASRQKARGAARRQAGERRLEDRVLPSASAGPLRVLIARVRMREGTQQQTGVDACPAMTCFGRRGADGGTSRRGLHPASGPEQAARSAP